MLVSTNDLSRNGRPISVVEARRRLACENLKRCPVCDTLNASTNEECFVCRWHGKFYRDPVSIEEGLSKLVSRCPTLRAPRPAPPTHESKRSLTSLLRLLRKRIDYRV